VEAAIPGCQCGGHPCRQFQTARHAAGKPLHWQPIFDPPWIEGEQFVFHLFMDGPPKYFRLVNP
jgi:hypothetical protein